MPRPLYEFEPFAATGSSTSTATNPLLINTDGWAITVPTGFTADQINIQVNK